MNETENETGMTMDSPPAGPTGATGAAASPGMRLAAAREAMGLSVEQLAGQLKLAARQIVALETDDHAHLPEAAVVRGFVRAYAKVVKLDPAPLVAMIALDVSGNDPAESVRLKPPARLSELHVGSGARYTALALWAVAGLLLLVVLLGLSQSGLIPATLFQRGEPASAVRPSAPVPARAAMVTTSAPSDDPKSVVIELAALSSPRAAVVPDAAVPVAIAPPAVVAPPVAVVLPKAAPVPDPVPGNSALVLKVRRDCWIEIRRSGGGKPLISRLVKGGSTETFEVSEPMLLIVGKPDAVDATLRGAALELNTVPGRVISRQHIK